MLTSTDGNFRAHGENPKEGGLVSFEVVIDRKNQCFATIRKRGTEGQSFNFSRTRDLESPEILAFEQLARQRATAPKATLPRKQCQLLH